MNADGYMELLEARHVLEFFRQTGGALFQQDGATCHTARKQSDGLSRKALRCWRAGRRIPPTCLQSNRSGASRSVSSFNATGCGPLSRSTSLRRRCLRHSTTSSLEPSPFSQRALSFESASVLNGTANLSGMRLKSAAVVRAFRSTRQMKFLPTCLHCLQTKAMTPLAMKNKNKTFRWSVCLRFERTNKQTFHFNSYLQFLFLVVPRSREPV